MSSKWLKKDVKNVVQNIKKTGEILYDALDPRNVVKNIKSTGETLSDALTIISHPNFLHPFSKSGHNEWDDGSEHDGVIKIHVGTSRKGIKYVKFDYVRNGQTKEAPLHGVNHGRSIEAYTFVINHPEEYLASVEAWYSNLGLIHGLKFKSNKKTSALFGHDEGNLFTLLVHDRKIVGFHGFSGNKLHSLDAYFAPLTISTPLTTIKKLEAKGGERDLWDDGVHENVRKVYVGKGRDGVAFLKVEYVDGYQVVVGDEHGKDIMLGTEEFEVDDDDYIVYVEGYRDKVNETTAENISFLRFKTYKGKATQPIEKETPAKFVLQGGKIVGFHGRSTDVLHSLGAYISFSPTPKLCGNWIKMVQKREGPGLRCSHAIAQVGNKIYSFGGEFTPNYPIDKHLFVFDIETRSWSVAPATGDIPDLSCLGVGMVSIGSTLYVFGGRDASRKYNGFYSFDTTINEWKLLTPVEEGPTPRSFHSMAADEENVYVFGGVSATRRLKTLHSYNIFNHKWVQCSTPGESFSIRGGGGLEVVHGKVWVVYGFNGTELDDVHYYVPVRDRWTQVNTLGESPSKRSVFASAVVGKHIVMFGGEIQMDPLAHMGPGQLSDGTFALDTETLKWERLDKLGVEAESPSIRGWTASTSATIDGKKGLVMLGGKAPTNDRFSELFFYEIDSA